MPFSSSFFDRQLLLNPFFLLTGALLFDEKIRQSAALFGLECGMLEFFKYSNHGPQSTEQLLTLPHFWRPVWRKRLQFVPIQPVCRRNRGIRRFLHKRLRTLIFFKCSRSELKNPKPIRVYVLFKAYPMALLSG